MMASFLVVDMLKGEAVVEYNSLEGLDMRKPGPWVAAECHSGMSLYSWDWERFTVGMELLKLRRIMVQLNVSKG